MAKRIKRRDYPPNSVIVHEGAAGTSMFFVAAGAVEVRRKDPHTGINFLLTELGPGQNFGEMSLLTGTPARPASRPFNRRRAASWSRLTFSNSCCISQDRPGLDDGSCRAGGAGGSQLGIEFINLSKLHYDPRVLALLPLSLINLHKVVPLALLNNRLSLAMVNPNNIIAFDDVRHVVKGVMIEPVMTTEDDFKRFMSTTYPLLMKKASGESPSDDASSGHRNTT